MWGVVMRSTFLHLNRSDYFFPKIADITALPTFRSKPCRVVGMPVLRATFCLTAVMPTARLSEKLSPGIFIGL